MRAVLRAFPTLLRIGFAEAVAYRAEMIVWMLSTTMPLVSLALWHAAAADGPLGPGGRYGQKDLIAYFLAGLIVRQLTASWVVWEMNMEIRSGTLALRLLRPIHPVWSYSAENLAALPFRGAISLPVAAVMLIAAGGEHFAADPVTWLLAAVAILGAWLITFLLMVAIGTLAFHLESSSGLFEVYLGAFFVLSGYLFPLELLTARAPWIAEATHVLPFYYQVGFPIELLLGLHDRAAALRLLGVQYLYVAVFFVAATQLWRLGMRRFNAYGA